MGERPTDTRHRERSRALELFDTAGQLIGANRVHDAIESLTEVLRLNPTFTDARVLRGVAYGDLKENDAAMSDLDAAIAASAYVSNVAYSVRARIHSERGNHDQAILDYSEAISRQPTDAHLWGARGTQHLARGDCASAIVDFTKALQLRPGSAAVFAQRGDAYSRTNRLHEAIADYDAALAVREDWPESIRNGAVAVALATRAMARDILGDMAGALADLNAAIELHPSTNAYCHRGHLHNDTGDFGAAIRDFTAALELSPGYSNANIGRGRAYAKRDEPFEAIRNFDRAIEVDPQNDLAYQNRADARRMLGQHREAIADLERATALQQRPTLQRAMIRASTLLAGGDAQGAVRELDEALAFNPKSTDVMVRRGHVREQLGDRDGAWRDFTAALRLSPDNAAALTGRGLIYFQLEKYKRAVKELTQAIGADPKSPSAYAVRGKAHLALGETDKAKQDFETARRLDPSLTLPPVEVSQTI